MSDTSLFFAIEFMLGVACGYSLCIAVARLRTHFKQRQAIIAQSLEKVFTNDTKATLFAILRKRETKT
jgi:NhaP-type Na+/H+ or K+/H+ antiporter